MKAGRIAYEVTLPHFYQKYIPLFTMILQPSSNYSSKVYVGNWYEDRCAYKKTSLPYTTTYNTSYYAKPYSANDPNVMWKTKIENEVLNSKAKIIHIEIGLNL